MASQQVNPVEEIVKDLKTKPGFKGYLILNNDGIVVRWSSDLMTYQKAVQYAHHILDLYTKSKAHIKDVFDNIGPVAVTSSGNAPVDGSGNNSNSNAVESIRLRTNEYEMIVAQQGNFTLIVIQNDAGTNDTNDNEPGEGEGDSTAET